MMILSYKETQLLRGLAIFLIIVHNFCHLLPGAIAENEYLWSIEPILRYNQYLLHGGPHLILNLFSHYGFYGIALFIFLSGYGLSVKYDKQEDLSLVSYLVRHAKKLWQLLFVGILVLYFSIRIFGGHMPSLDHIVKLSLFVSNLLPNRTLIFGPWWWFSLIMQFYVIYYLFYYKRGMKTICFFTLFCLILQLAVTYYCRHDLQNENGPLCYFHFNFPSLTLPFTLGVYVSRHHPSWLYSKRLLLLSILIVILGSYNVWIWCIACVFACIALINFGHLFGRVNWINLFLSWLGMISAWAFVFHPIVRKYVFRTCAMHSVYYTLSIYLIVTLILSFVTYKVMEHIIQGSHSIRESHKNEKNTIKNF